MPPSKDSGEHGRSFQLKSLFQPASSPRDQDRLARQCRPLHPIHNQLLPGPALSQQIQEQVGAQRPSLSDACDPDSFTTEDSTGIEIPPERTRHHSAIQVSGKEEERNTTVEGQLNSEARAADDLTVRDALASSLRSPLQRYQLEIAMEIQRMGAFRFTDCCNQLTREWLCLPLPVQEHVLARHFVRRRWQMLGLWQSEWHLTPDQETEAMDWKWPWGAVCDEKCYPSMVASAIQCCGRLRPGEYGMDMMKMASEVWPEDGWGERRKWTEHQSWDERRGYNFIRSRPWFAFEVEVAVQTKRRRESPVEDRDLSAEPPALAIRQQWAAQGIWNDAWDGLKDSPSTGLVGWMWKDEQCVPELAYLEQLNDLDDMDFTVSELDVLEESWARNTGPGIEIWDELKDIEPVPGSELRNPGLGISMPMYGSRAGSEGAGETESEGEEDKENIEPPNRGRTRSQPDVPLRRSARIAEKREQKAAQEAVRGQTEAQSAQTRLGKQERRATPQNKRREQVRRREPLRSQPQRVQPKRAAKRSADDDGEDAATHKDGTGQASKPRRRG